MCYAACCFLIKNTRTARKRLDSGHVVSVVWFHLESLRIEALVAGKVSVSVLIKFRPINNLCYNLTAESANDWLIQPSSCNTPCLWVEIDLNRHFQSANAMLQFCRYLNYFRPNLKSQSGRVLLCK